MSYIQTVEFLRWSTVLERSSQWNYLLMQPRKRPEKARIDVQFLFKPAAMISHASYYTSYCLSLFKLRQFGLPLRPYWEYNYKITQWNFDFYFISVHWIGISMAKFFFPFCVPYPLATFCRLIFWDVSARMSYGGFPSIPKIHCQQDDSTENDTIRLDSSRSE